MLGYNCIKLAHLKAGTALNTFINKNVMGFLLFAGNCLLRTGPEARSTAGALICINGIGNQGFAHTGGAPFYPSIWASYSSLK